ncbi:MAG TPA: hypothetical protein VG225_10595 [Terracidiphilus sp.]|nr:hypothetical protein [Terracidiphilus sp.]
MNKVRISFFLASGLCLLMMGCGGGSSTTTPPPNPTAPAVSVTPAASSITTVQSVSVTVAVSGSSGVPTGSVTLKSGSYTSGATTLASGGANIQIAAGALAAASDTLSATYTPDAASTSNYTTATGSGTVTVTKATPTMTVTPSSANITPLQILTVTVAVSGGSGAPAATGTVTLTSGSFTSPATTLATGSATIPIAAGVLATGSDTLSVAYTPDTAGAAIYNTASGTNSVTVGKIAPTVTVTPASSSINTQQSLSVTVAVAGGTGNPTPSGTVKLTSGTFASSQTTLASGSASIVIPAASLPAGNNTLTVAYTPDTSSASVYANASGTAPVTVAKITPAMAVTPASASIYTSQDLKVTVAVSVPAGDTAATGSVTLSSGTYTSSATALSSGSATIDIPANSLAAGSDTLSASYTPDAGSLQIYNTAKGTSSAVTVALLSTVAVNQGVSGPALTDKLLGVNMAAWFDPTTSYVVPALQAAGIKALRWPGGSWSDEYHWKANMMCQGTAPNLTTGGWADPGALYTSFITGLQIPLGADVALTADYGTDAACTGPGDPTEAADWVQAWETAGGTLSHVTVGNEEYGTWETDLHTKPNDAATYASAAQTYYSDIKAVDKNVLVGVDVDADSTTGGAWDSTVLGNAKGSYDFVEFHYYPETPGQETDAFLVQKAAPKLTDNINILKAELTTAGKPNTPIYVGEIGGPYSDPGKQSWSITQGLYAGQVLGEMMNDGVSRLTWWIGFGNCNGSSGNDSATLYGWQTFGAYNVFSDGASDTTCPDAGPGGTMSPTARAFQLFSNVAVNGENALTASVNGDTTDVRAYAATHSGGTALVLFNLNQNASAPVQITLSAEANSPGVKVITYSKAIYDDTQNNKWDPPTTTDLGAQSLPLTLTLDPWSMNVVMIQ